MTDEDKAELDKLQDEDNDNVLDYWQSKITGQKPAEKKVEKAEPLKGDLNGDGKVNVTDIELLAAHVKGKKMLK